MVLYLSDIVLKEFLAHISRKTDRRGNYIEPISHQTYDHVNGYRSAIMNKFKELGIKVPEESRAIVNNFIGKNKNEQLFSAECIIKSYILLFSFRRIQKESSRAKTKRRNGLG